MPGLPLTEPSLRLRLGLWYGALTGLVVVLVTLLTYALHTRGHYDDLDHVLVGVAVQVVDQLNDPMVAMHADPVSAPSTAGLVLRVYDAAGRLAESSPGAELAPSVPPRSILVGPSSPPYDPLVGLAPSFMPTDLRGGALGVATDEAGGRWRLFAAPLSGGRTLLAAMPLDRVDASVAWFRRLVPLLALLGAALTLSAGVLLAGRALRPVAALTESAATIARERDFEHRVPEPARQDELGRLARTFNSMLDSLQRAFQAQKQFVADASHELRAPLTTIAGNLELVEHHPDMSLEERQEAVAEASRETRRLAQLVADLLALARADAGVPIRWERVELDRVLLDAVGQARHLLNGQRLEIGTLETAEVQGDSDRLRQLVLIVIDNALKYTPAGGTVSLALRHSESIAALEFCDTGIGIPADDLPRVFDRFYRADPARRRDEAGTGLGLSIARWIVDQHHGEICLESEPGRGTRVSITLPLAT